MRYTQGTVGRIFILRFEEGDSVITEIEAFAKKETIRAGVVQIIGGLRHGRIVTGPAEETPDEIRPHYEAVEQAGDMLGIGTLFWANERPVIHLHAGVGNPSGPLVGCLREPTETFLVLEAIVTEIVGTAPQRVKESRTGACLLEIPKEETTP